MKKIIFLALAAAFFAAVLPCCGQNVPEDGWKVLENNKFGIDVHAMGDYFTAVLEGRDAGFADDRTVSPEEAEEIRGLVWAVWAMSNSEFDEDRIPELSALEGKFEEREVSGTWALGPEEMRFFYGYKGEKPDSGYPLFLCLHGSGDNDYEFRATYAWAQRYDDAPSLYFIPRSPKGGTGCRWYQPTRQQAWERLFRQSYLSGAVDAGRVYVFGISEGAYGSQRLASFYADYLAGAGPIAGGEQMFWAPPENCASIAFCLQTGEEDTMYGRKLLTERALAKFDLLQAAHPGYYEHKIDLQPGKGHGCDYTVTTPYLKGFVRNPYPKYVYWENLPLGNINGEGAAFRSGFYNLRVKERSTDDSDDFVRSCYEMNIEDNTVGLDVNVVTIKPDNFVESNEGWSMNVGESKTFVPASKGRIVIYLNDSLVDLSEPVTVVVNGQEKFRGKVDMTLRDMVESCAEFFDPARLYPASVEVSIE